MRGRATGTSLLRAATTAAAVTAVVLGSAVGLNDWADTVATHVAPAARVADDPIT